MRSRVSRSISILLVATVGLALVAGACTNDDKAASEKDGDEAASEKDSEAEATEGDQDSAERSETDPAESDMTSEEFSRVVADSISAINAATDICDLATAAATVQVDRLPQTPDEAREYVDLFMALYNKMADTASDEATAEALRTGAQSFKDYAESLDFDPEKLNDDTSEEPFEGADEFTDATNKYGAEARAQCEQPGGAPTPEGDPSG